MIKVQDRELGETLNNIQAFVAGITFILFLIVVGLFFSDNISSAATLGPIKLILAATFTGTSFGYYLGKASSDDLGPGASFMMGILSTLIVILVYGARISLPTSALVLSGVTMFLGYDSGLLREHTELEKWLERIKLSSWGGLLIIGFVQFGFPLLWDLSSWLTRSIQSTLEVLSGMSQTRLYILTALIILSTILIIRLLIMVYRDN